MHHACTRSLCACVWLAVYLGDANVERYLDIAVLRREFEQKLTTGIVSGRNWLSKVDMPASFIGADSIFVVKTLNSSIAYVAEGYISGRYSHLWSINYIIDNRAK